MCVPFAASAINTPEVQSSEDAGLQKDVACSPFISDPLLNLLNSVESAKMEGEELDNSLTIDQNAHFKSSSVEEQAWCRSVKDTEASCKLGKQAEMSTCDRGNKRKRHCNQSEKFYGIYRGRILRSAKRHSSKGLLRRSKQLFSKVCGYCS